MSEQQNIALVQSLYAAFGRGDVQMILDHLTPDVEWTMEGPDIVPFTGKKVGPSQVATFFQALATTQTNHNLTTADYVAQGNNVATFGRYSGIVIATGKKFDSAVAHFFTIRDGKICRFLDFIDTAQMVDAYTARAAAGA